MRAVLSSCCAAMSPTAVYEKPEEAELRKKREALAALQTTLAERELLFASTRASVREFERRYVVATGHLFARLDELNAQIAEREAARRSGDAQANETAKNARVRADASAAAASSELPAAAGNLNTSRLKDLYRTLAKSIHPDLATDDADRARRVRLMVEVNAAYESGDEARLQQLLAEIEASPDSVKGSGVAPDLVRAIRGIAQVERRLSEIERELAELCASEMYKLMMLVADAAGRGIDHVSQIFRTLSEQIAVAERQLRASP